MMRFPKRTLLSTSIVVASLGIWIAAQEGGGGQRGAGRAGAAGIPGPGAGQPGAVAPEGTAPIGNTSPFGKDQGKYPLSPNEKGGMDETGPYEVVPDHFKPAFPAGWTWAAVQGIVVESLDRVYVYTRGIAPVLNEYVNRTGLPVRDATAIPREGGDGKNGAGRKEYILTVYDRSGKMIEHWKHIDAMTGGAHRLRVNPWDPEKHLWLVDLGNNQIVKVTRDSGKVVMTVGPAQGYDPSLGQAEGYQDLAFMPNGDFFAVEGFRVVKFSKDGKQLMAFGKKGLGPDPSEIYRAHAITIDSRGRIYVAARGRLHVFDQTGKPLDTWPNMRFGSGAMVLDKNDRIWVGDAEIHRIAGYDMNGKLFYHWGVAGVDPGRLYGLSQMAVDSLGNLYTAEHYGGRVQMFRPKKGANPNHLIGQLVQ